MKNYIRKIMLIALIGAVTLNISGCKKLIEVAPSRTQLLSSEVFKDSATIQQTLSGLYFDLSLNQGSPVYQYETSTLCGFSADELTYVGAGNTYTPFIENGITVNDGNVESIWSGSYSIIYIANSIIEGVAGSSAISDKSKNQVTAEAKFIRAFCYFYLVNLYGDVPLILTTDVVQNETLARTPASTVYNQIVSDLEFAQSNLLADYSVSSNTRTRANKWVATALLSKVYLYTQQWKDAEAQVDSLISNSSLFSLSSNLTQVFTPTSKEAIWQFYNDLKGYTEFAAAVLPNPVSLIPTYILTPQLAGAFEPGDERKSVWVDSLQYNSTVDYYPYKYKSLVSGANTEYFTVFRLAEQYLIRAEARAHESNVSGAQSDINAIRNRAGLANTTANDQASLLTAVEHERQVELFCECGNRWFDLKRTNRTDAVLGSEKKTWKSSAALYPIPQGEINLNANLTQNPGY